MNFRGSSVSERDIPSARPASLFDVGKTCPWCQEAMTEGQQVVTCGRCGSVHHDTCWSRGEGCASYHCARRDNVALDGRAPEIVISGADAAQATPPAPRPRTWASGGAAATLPARPTRLSVNALLSTVFAALALVALVAGALRHGAALPAAGVVCCLGAILTGVLGLLATQGTAASRRGLALALGSTLASSILVVLLFLEIGGGFGRRASYVSLGTDTATNLPSATSLEAMPATRADALRANVVLLGTSRTAGSTLGSGVVLKTAGGRAFILTNRHVLDASSRGCLRVLFYTGARAAAAEEWLAPDGVDLAVVSCEVSLPVPQKVRLAESLIEAGTPVFAIGNPMGLNWSYTEGVISGVRQQRTSGGRVTVYQTQTPINYGNSGGGLYDRDGRLVGINTWIEDKSVAEGLNFALAVTTLREFMDESQRVRFLP